MAGIFLFILLILSISVDCLFHIYVTEIAVKHSILYSLPSTPNQYLLTYRQFPKNNFISAYNFSQAFSDDEYYGYYDERYEIFRHVGKGWEFNFDLGRVNLDRHRLFNYEMICVNAYLVNGNPNGDNFCLGCIKIERNEYKKKYHLKHYYDNIEKYDCVDKDAMNSYIYSAVIKLDYHWDEEKDVWNFLTYTICTIISSLLIIIIVYSCFYRSIHPFEGYAKDDVDGFCQSMNSFIHRHGKGDDDKKKKMGTAESVDIYLPLENYPVDKDGDQKYNLNNYRHVVRSVEEDEDEEEGELEVREYGVIPEDLIDSEIFYALTHCRQTFCAEDDFKFYFYTAFFFFKHRIYNVILVELMFQFLVMVPIALYFIFDYYQPLLYFFYLLYFVVTVNATRKISIETERLMKGKKRECKPKREKMDKFFPYLFWYTISTLIECIFFIPVMFLVAILIFNFISYVDAVAIALIYSPVLALFLPVNVLKGVFIRKRYYNDMIMCNNYHNGLISITHYGIFTITSMLIFIIPIIGPVFSTFIGNCVASRHFVIRYYQMRHHNGARLLGFDDIPEHIVKQYLPKKLRILW